MLLYIVTFAPATGLAGEAVNASASGATTGFIGAAGGSGGFIGTGGAS